MGRAWGPAAPLSGRVGAARSSWGATPACCTQSVNDAVAETQKRIAALREGGSAHDSTQPQVQGPPLQTCFPAARALQMAPPTARAPTSRHAPLADAAARADLAQQAPAAARGAQGPQKAVGGARGPLHCGAVRAPAAAQACPAAGTDGPCSSTPAGGTTWLWHRAPWGPHHAGHRGACPATCAARHVPPGRASLCQRQCHLPAATCCLRWLAVCCMARRQTGPASC